MNSSQRKPFIELVQVGIELEKLRHLGNFDGITDDRICYAINEWAKSWPGNNYPSLTWNCGFCHEASTGLSPWGTEAKGSQVMCDVCHRVPCEGFDGCEGELERCVGCERFLCVNECKGVEQIHVCRMCNECFVCITCSPNHFCPACQAELDDPNLKDKLLAEGIDVDRLTARVHGLVDQISQERTFAIKCKCHVCHAVTTPENNVVADKWIYCRDCYAKKEEN